MLTLPVRLMMERVARSRRSGAGSGSRSRQGRSVNSSESIRNPDITSRRLRAVEGISVGIVPQPERVQLPKEEPRPAHTDPPEPQPYEQRAGDLSVGYIQSISETQHRRHAPTKHLHPGPLGFAPPTEDDSKGPVNKGA